MSERANEPLTPLIESAVQMHEWFQSLIGSGFTEVQAIALMAAIIRPEQA